MAGVGYLILYVTCVFDLCVCMFVRVQCDLGSNYRGLFMLVSAVNVPEYRERSLYGCMSREFGVIPPEVYPNWDPSQGTSTVFP